MKRHAPLCFFIPLLLPLEKSLFLIFPITRHLLPLLQDKEVLDPVDAHPHLAPLADGKGEEEGHGEADCVEHGKAQEGFLSSEHLRKTCKQE